MTDEEKIAAKKLADAADSSRKSVEEKSDPEISQKNLERIKAT